MESSAEFSARENIALDSLSGSHVSPEPSLHEHSQPSNHDEVMSRDHSGDPTSTSRQLQDGYPTQEYEGRQHEALLQGHPQEPTENDSQAVPLVVQNDLPTQAQHSEQSELDPRPQEEEQPEPQIGGTSDIMAASGVRRSASEWWSWKVQWPFVLLLIGSEIGIIVAIAVLMALSDKNNGIVSLIDFNLAATSDPSLLQTVRSEAYGLLWTSLPSALIGLYRVGFEIHLGAVAFEKPFVTLHEKTRSVKKTIMLDYNIDGGIFGLGLMKRNRHWGIMLATVLNFIMNIAVVSLTSHLLQAAPTASNRTISLQYSSEFDGSGASSGNADISPYMDVANAVLCYGATPPAWVTTDFAITPFSTASTPANGTVLLNTTQFSAFLDCQIVPPSNYTESSSVSNSSTSSSFTIDDRGCKTVQEVDSLSEEIYSVAWSEQGCGLDSSRFGLLSGARTNGSRNSPLNATVISCIPSYWYRTAFVALSLRPDKEPLIVSSDTSVQLTQFHEVYGSYFELALSQYEWFDASNTFKANRFGFITYIYSQIRNPQNPLDPATLKDSFASIFSTTHAAMVPKILVAPSRAYNQPAMLSKPVTKLFIVKIVAWITIATFILLLFSNMWLVWQKRGKHTMLHEEPIGLLGNAMIVQDSDVLTAARQIRGQHPPDTKFREVAEAEYDLEHSVCYYDNASGHIHVKPLVTKSSSGIPVPRSVWRFRRRNQ